jgi:uncharacterized protein
MLNYRVAPELLEPYVAAGTELDAWHGSHYVSIVGFLFRHTRVLGVRVPLHSDFEEVNLRFYVRRTAAGEVRRAVTFIRELVPRAAIAIIAHAVYNEPYRAVPMAHEIALDAGAPGPARVEYRWRVGRLWSKLSAYPIGPASPAAGGSEEAFITEHDWGYTRQRDGSTLEYEVRHPPWRVWQVSAASLTGDLGATYGAKWAAALTGKPASAFVADGSAVMVFPPKRLIGAQHS